MSLPARALTVSAVAAFVVAAFLFAWWAADVLLVVFAGIIVALALRGAAEWLATRTRMPPAIAVAVVVLGVVALLAFAGWGLADEVARQFTELAERLPRAVREVAGRIERTSWGQLLLARLPDTQSVVSPTVVSRATGALAATLGVTAGALANVVIVVFIAVYASLDPGVYRRGIVRMVPGRGRRRAEQVLHVLAVTLRRWFVGRLVAMVIIGSLTALGLWLVGVPLALTLGLLAGLLNFVPYIGPLVSFVPAALLALVEGPTMLAWVGVLYVAVQTIESYVVTPMIEQHAVLLPPALTLTAQVLLGVVFGFPGLLLATPLTAAAITVVKLLYVEGVLGEDIEMPGDASPPVARAA
jgi:predicted PurR-regulated permease PerM